MGMSTPSGVPYRGPEPVRYLFVDGPALKSSIDRQARKLGPEVIDYKYCYKKIFVGFRRVFFYDAVPVIKDGQTSAEYDAILKAKEDELDQISRIPATHVRTGLTKYRRKVKDADTGLKGAMEQKGVDVQLCVDVQRMAYERNMDEAVVITNDLDMFPLFEALTFTPVRSRLRYDPQVTSLDLIRCADFADEINEYTLQAWATDDLMPSVRTKLEMLTGARKIAGV